jgi:hypothetical protein
MAASFVSLFRPQYPRLRAALRLASSVAGVATFYLFLLTGEFVVANPSAAARLNDPVHIGDHVFTAGQLANYGAAAAPLIALVVFFCDGLVEVTRLLRARRQPRIVTQEWNGIF